MRERDNQILKIAIPSIVSNITVPLLGLVDVAITGHLGASCYVGAIAVGGMLFNTIYWLFVFLRMGTSGMTSQAYGRRDLTEVVSILMRSVMIALGCSVAVVALQYVVREGALYFIAPSEDVADLARTYFDICIWGAPASLMLFALSGWSIGMQNSRIPMTVAIVQNVLNIVMSLVFVYCLHMKVEGVALGTMLAQWCGLITAIVMIWVSYHRLMKYAVRHFVDRKSMIRFFSLNKDIFLRTCCLVLVHFSFVSAGAKLGDTELSVNTLLMQFFTLYSYIMDGFAFAGEALVGKSIGAGNMVAYRDTIKRLFVWGWWMAGAFTIAYILCGNMLVNVLTDEPMIMEASSEYLPWIMLMPVCGMAAFIWDGVYIGRTYSRGMLISMASGVVVFFAVYYALVPFFGNHGLLVAFLSYLATRGIAQWIIARLSWCER